MSSTSELLEFAQRLLVVLEQGRRTATYKYAVLIAMMDLSLEAQDPSGASRDSFTTPELAQRVLELYWPHTREYRGEPGRVLRQNRGGQAEIITAIQSFRARPSIDPAATLAKARAGDAPAFKRLLREIEWKLVEMPLPRVQTILATEQGPFLYTIGWDETIRRKEFDARDFDNRVNLFADVGAWLAELAPLLRPIIQQRWASEVARFNRDLIEDSQLEDFLFGMDRAALTPVRRPLLELQAHACFYCGRRVEGAAEVDHFLPWARHPTNALDNLVVAHRDCNGAKSDHLAALRHLARWRERRAQDLDSLEQISRELAWEPPAPQTLAVVRSVYLRLPALSKLWVEGRRFEDAKLEDVLRALAS